jgi:stage V sporulation protein B
MVMVLTTVTTMRVTKTKLPYFNLFKVTIASFILGLGLLLMPKTILGLILSLILLPFVYLILLGLTRALQKRDLIIINQIGNRLGPLSSIITMFTGFLERFIVKET